MSQREGKRGSRGVRMWVDELPDGAEFDCARIVKGPKVAALSSSPIHAILVESALISNHWQYALLGGRFEVANSGEFQIEACIGSRNGPPPEWLYAQPSHGFGAVRVGLSEMTAGLVTSLATQFSEGSLPAGVLHVNCGAESQIATSAYSIYVATFLLLQTLARGTLPEDEDHLLQEAKAARIKASSLPSEYKLGLVLDQF